MNVDDMVPNTIQVPKLYIEKMMRTLTGNEWKVLIYWIYKPDATFSQIEIATGLSPFEVRACARSIKCSVDNNE